MQNLVSVATITRVSGLCVIWWRTRRRLLGITANGMGLRGGFFGSMMCRSVVLLSIILNIFCSTGVQRGCPKGASVDH